MNKMVAVYLLFWIFGDWGLGIGDWGLGPIPNPPSPIPNPQSPIPHLNTYHKKKTKKSSLIYICIQTTLYMLQISVTDKILKLLNYTKKFITGGKVIKISFISLFFYMI